MADKKVEEEDLSKMITLKPNVIGTEHYFDYVSGTEVQCIKCPLGYGVTPETKIKGGHIYIKDKLVI